MSKKLISELRDKIKNKTKEIENLTEITKERINEISIKKEVKKKEEKK